MTYHALVRTNEKGVPGVFRCIQCGLEGLPAEAVSLQCDNPKGMTQEQSLLHVIEKRDVN